MNNRSLRKITISNDIWLHILPFFGRFELGLKLALLSFLFDSLVDKYFAGKTELTIWRKIKILTDIGENEPKLAVCRGRDGVALEFELFPLPALTLPNKIRFGDLDIEYIDHNVIAFLRANKQIFDKGTDLHIVAYDNSIWEVLAREIWPVFTENIRHLGFSIGDNLNSLRRLISPAILSKLKWLNSIASGCLLPDAIADDGPNATAGQALAKWLHRPTTDGQPKRLRCFGFQKSGYSEWADNFKEAFLRATTSATYAIELGVLSSTQIEPFELVNEVIQEKLTLSKANDYIPNVREFLLQRCPIGQGPTVRQQKVESSVVLNKIYADFRLGPHNCIGPLSSPAAEVKRSNEMGTESSEPGGGTIEEMK